MRTFTGSEFEDEVKRICRSLFSDSIGQGSEKIDGRERDGVFWNGSFFTIVEATTDRRKDKALYDAKKTHELVTKKRSEGYMATGYLVTLHEPTADQREAVRKYERTTKIISFDELRSLLFDAQGYLRIRSGKPFGSVFDHASHTFEVPRSDFVSPTITKSQTGSIVSVADVGELVKRSSRIIITAEYGIGKSMLLREIFFLLLQEFSNGNTFRFPVAINLRDHLGQSDPIELLERHARSNASDPRKLVAAWCAGYVDLIIDGFDELSTRGWTGDHRKLREFKRSTHSVVKNLIRDTPRVASVIISGRTAYFDSENEMREALGTPEASFDHLLIQPFDTVQASEFLRRKGYSAPIPQWLPTRPLFLSYLINKNLLSDAVSVSSHGSFPEGTAWSVLLAMIAGRESEQSEGVDKESILQFWGMLATKARQGDALQKSFSPVEVDDIFYKATGNSVSEDERRLLLRLPGLGISPDNASNRIFIDIDFVNAASARLLAMHVKFPFGEEPYRAELRLASQQLNQVGTHVLCATVESDAVSTGLLVACFKREIELENYSLAYDLCGSLVFLTKLEGDIFFEGLEIQELDICQDVWDHARVTFSSCLISNLLLPPDGHLPQGLRFQECLFGNVEGRSSELDIPGWAFANCDFNNFSDSYNVNNSILDSSLPIGLRVLVVTLRKIYAQAGTSRLESALLRGLDHRARMIAPDVIDILKRHRFIIESGRQGKIIYAGTRLMRKEALNIIQSPANSRSGVVDECRKLS